MAQCTIYLTPSSVESANKVVVESRLKGAGMHWARPHVNPLVALRTIACSDRWAEAWPQIAQQVRHQAWQRRLRRLEASPQPQRAVAKQHPTHGGASSHGDSLHRSAPCPCRRRHSPSPLPTDLQPPKRRIGRHPTTRGAAFILARPAPHVPEYLSPQNFDGDPPSSTSLNSQGCPHP